MLKFVTDLEGSGSYLARSFTLSVGGLPSFGFTYPGYQSGIGRKIICEKRSGLDFLKTGPATYAGDHDCSQLQIDAEIYVPFRLDGPVTPYDNMYGVTASQWRVPDLYYGYDINTVMAAFGSVYSSSKIWNYRETPSGTVSHNGYPDVPFLVGRSYTKAFSARMSSNTLARYKLSAGIAVYDTLPTTDPNRNLYTCILHTCTLSYDVDGALRNTELITRKSVYACDATTPYGRAPRTISLKSDFQWSTSAGSYIETSNPSSLSIEDFRQIIARPSSLYGTLSVNPSIIESANPFGVPTLPYSIVATYDDSLTTSLERDKWLNTFFFKPIYLRDSTPVAPPWDELGDAAADNICQVSINSLAYVKDLGSILGTLSSVISLAGNPADPEKWATWWLSMRYGDRLTYRDTLTLSRAIGGEISSRFRKWNKNFYTSRARAFTTGHSESDHSDMKIERFIKLYYKPKFYDSISRAIVTALKWDFWPTLENSWDLIPLSFVVDWFVDVQGALETIDRQNLMLMHQVLSVLQTDKRTITFDDALVGDLFVTKAKAVAYERHRLRSLPHSPFRVERGHLASINVVDGASLLYQVF